MRLLILTQYFPPEVGAPQVRLFAMATELQRRGHEVEVVTAMPNYPAGEVFPAYRGRWFVREESGGIPIIRTWIYPATGRGVLKRLLSYWSFTLTALWGCLRAHPPDYVFVESPPLFLGLTGWLASRLRRAPYIFNVSDLWPESAVSMGIVTNRTLIGLAERLERFCYRHALKVCAVTDGIKETIMRVPGSAPVLLLPNGVDTAVFHRLDRSRARHLAEDSVAVFVFAGTHGYAQGLDVILDAARILKGRRDMKFVFVGDGPDKPRLRDLASGLDNVAFLDPVPNSEMPAVFSACRASIVPLRKLELFKSARPSKILPSLACETPVIYAGEGETVDLIESSRSGLVVPPECPERLAEAVVSLAEDADRARELGHHGRAMVESRFSWQGIVGTWLEQMGIA